MWFEYKYQFMCFLGRSQDERARRHTSLCFGTCMMIGCVLTNGDGERYYTRNSVKHGIIAMRIRGMPSVF